MGKWIVTLEVEAKDNAEAYKIVDKQINRYITDARVIDIVSKEYYIRYVKKT